MHPTRTTTSLQAIAVILSLGLTACAGSSESAPSINEAASSDATFATCSTASITVDRRTQYQASIAGFLEQARTSGCSYSGVQVADAQESGGEAYAGALEVARDFVDAFELPWELRPEADDPSLSVHSVRVTLLPADRQVAEAS